MNSDRLSLSVVISDTVNPSENLAIEEYLTMNTPKKCVVLFLWQNANTIVIGRNQNAYAELDVTSFRKDGGTLVRRLSGGGAVYHDTGNLNFTFMADRNWYDLSKQLEVILQGVRRFGIPAEKNGRNDITSDGKKFSGNAFYRSGRHCYHHGTLLVCADQDAMMRYLTPSKEKLKTKGVPSVRSRVMNLCEQYPELTIEALQRSMIESFEQVYGVKARAGSIGEWKNGEDVLPFSCTEDFEHFIRDRGAFFASDAWTLGRNIRCNVSRKARFQWGEAEICLDVDDDEVRDCIIYSDAMDQDMIIRAQNALIGSEFDDCAMSESILRIPAEGERMMMRDHLAKMFS